MHMENEKRSYAEESTPKIEPFSLPRLEGEAVPTEIATLDALGRMELDVAIDLGRAYVRPVDLARLTPGAIVPLDKPANAPVDIFVHGRLLARGEAIVLDGKICVRVTELVSAGSARN